MKKLKKWMLASGLFTLLLLVSGCVSTYKSGPNAGQPTGEGWVYNILVKPIGIAINYFVTTFNWNYGWAIIAITVLVRLLILPLGLYQAKKSLLTTEKTIALKPQIDAAQAKVKNAVTREEQMAAQAEMQQMYKENGISPLGGMGCLPLLIQMPIFSALFYAARYTQGISKEVFFGVNLGKSSILFVAIAGISYLIQGYLSTLGVPEEQKKTSLSMMFISPLMIVSMSFTAPAGVVLYWIVGGFFGCIQTLITNLYHKPKIRAAIAEELRNNPPRKVVTPIVEESKPVSPTVTNVEAKNSSGDGKRNRNAGKQKNKHK